MSESGSGLGIVGYDAYEFVVADLERSRRFYTAMMDVAEVARLGERSVDERGEQAVLFAAGKARCVCVASTENGSRRFPTGKAEKAFAGRPWALKYPASAVAFMSVANMPRLSPTCRGRPVAEEDTPR